MEPRVCRRFACSQRGRYMMRFVVASAVVLVGFVQEAHAFCTPGDERVCFLNGQQGTQTCGPDARFGPCEVPSPPPPPSGWIQPKYKIVTVLYAPPGKTGGGSTSSVSYGSGSSTGTTTTSSHGFKQSYSISASADFNVFLNSSASLSFSYGRN